MFNDTMCVCGIIDTHCIIKQYVCVTHTVCVHSIHQLTLKDAKLDQLNRIESE